MSMNAINFYVTFRLSSDFTTSNRKSPKRIFLSCFYSLVIMGERDFPVIAYAYNWLKYCGNCVVKALLCCWSKNKEVNLLFNYIVIYVRQATLNK